MPLFHVTVTELISQKRQRSFAATSMDDAKNLATTMFPWQGWEVASRKETGYISHIEEKGKPETAVNFND